MNYAWIAALPLLLSPQSEPKLAACQDTCPGMCEKTRAAIEKALEVTRSATQNGMRKTHEAITEAHKQLEHALKAVQSSDWKLSTDSLKALNLAMPARAFTLGKNGQLTQIRSTKTLQGLAEKLQGLTVAQGQGEAEESDEADEADEAEEADMGDEADAAADEAKIAAEEAEVAAAEAATESAEAGEQAQVEAGEYLQKIREKLHKNQGWKKASSEPAQASKGQSRELEERITALEHRLGMRRDASHGSLEERVAALERLTPLIATPGRAWSWTPGAPHGGVTLLPSVPGGTPPPAMKDEKPAELWEQPMMPRVDVAPATPHPSMAPRAFRFRRGSESPATPEAPRAPEASSPPDAPEPAEAPRALIIPRRASREIHGLGYAGPDGRGGAAADHRREIEERMRKMREEMEKLREEMTRLREELGQRGDQAR